MHKNTRAALAVCTLFVLLSGCASQPTPESDVREVPEVSIDGLEDVVATVDYETGTVALPSDSYDIQAPEYVVRMLHAIAVRADQCMIDKGFDAIADQTDWSPFSKPEDRIFGRWSPKLASVYGAGRADDSLPPQVSLVAYGPDFSNAYNECAEVAKGTLKDEINFSQGPNVALDIRFGALQMAQDSEAGKKALADWRECSEAAGVVLDPNDGMPVEEYKTQGKEAEIEAYTTHAECAQSSGAIQTLADLRARYETALIEVQEAQLVEFTKQRDEVIKSLDDAIAGR